MKKLLILLTAVPAFLSAGAADHLLEPTSKITHVTVFLQQAQVTRAVTAQLKSGRTKVTIGGLTPLINAGSIRVKGTGAVTILSVTPKVNFLEGTKKPRALVNLEDSLESLNLDLKFNLNLKSVYEEEKRLILSNKTAGWRNGDFNVEDLEDLSDFYRDRLADVSLKMLELKGKEVKLRADIQRINSQLNKMRNSWKKRTSQVEVELLAEKATRVNLEVSYVVGQAGWTPIYDLRAEKVGQPVELKYNAHVYQNTGVDWSKVRLKLSTGNPLRDNSQPVLKPWTLVEETYRPNLNIRGARSGANAYYIDGLAVSGDSLKQKPMDGFFMSSDRNNYKRLDNIAYLNENQANYTGAYTTVTDNQVNVNFDISIPYTIPSDGEKHLVNVGDFQLPATYLYYAAPKVAETAFLMARVTGWESRNIIPGTANIYFDGSYIGQSYIDTDQTGDTLGISLGRDPAVVVKREKVKAFSQNKSAGSKKLQTRGFRLTVRNTKSKPITIEIEDHIPVSKQKSIEVTLVESGGAKHNEADGKLKWTRTVGPSSTSEVSFKYTVKYPKDQPITDFN